MGSLGTHKLILIFISALLLCVCNAHGSLQGLIDSASDGDTIDLGGQTFVIAQPVHIDKSIRIKNGEIIGQFGSGAIFDLAIADGKAVELVGLKLSGMAQFLCNTDTWTQLSLTVARCVSNGQAIRVGGTIEYLKLRDNVMHAAAGSHPNIGYIDLGATSVVERADIIGNTIHGGHGSDALYAFRGEVSRLRLQNNRAIGQSFYGFSIQSKHGAIVTGNSAEDGRHGFRVFGTHHHSMLLANNMAVNIASIGLNLSAIATVDGWLFQNCGVSVFMDPNDPSWPASWSLIRSSVFEQSPLQLSAESLILDGNFFHGSEVQLYGGNSIRIESNQFEILQGASSGIKVFEYDTVSGVIIARNHVKWSLNAIEPFLSITLKPLAPFPDHQGFCLSSTNIYVDKPASTPLYVEYMSGIVVDCGQ